MKYKQCKYSASFPLGKQAPMWFCVPCAKEKDRPNLVFFTLTENHYKVTAAWLNTACIFTHN